MEMHRQGDILFVRTEETVPKGSQRQDDGIVAKGEITGHHHRISNGTKAALWVAANMVMIVEAHQKTDIVHEEHNTITLPPGNWEVRRQREYEPGGWRQVID